MSVLFTLGMLSHLGGGGIFPYFDTEKQDTYQVANLLHSLFSQKSYCLHNLL